MFRNDENDEEYVAESYNFDEEETVLVSTYDLRTYDFLTAVDFVVVCVQLWSVDFCVRSFEFKFEFSVQRISSISRIF